MFDKLFSPIQIRGLELKNRVVMSAMGTYEAKNSPDEYAMTDKLIGYHVARAEGGCALNTLEVCSVYQPNAPKGYPSIANDSYLPGLTDLCSAIHKAGGKACIQLWCAGLGAMSDPNATIYMPSEYDFMPGVTIPEIDENLIETIIEAYGEAAARAVKAGFDTVEFHCAHNYLPHTFLSGAFNHRSDKWGGSRDNRERFPLECIRSIRRNIPEDMPIFMRISCHDDMLENGLTIEDIIHFCRNAKEAGCDVLNVSRGNVVSAANVYEVPPVDIPNGINVEPAARIRKETGMLVMPCGRINKPELAEEILEQDKADLVVISRAQLADPEFCNKAKEGRLTSIKYCTGCVQGCLGYTMKIMEDWTIPHITCMRNPGLLEEITNPLAKTDSPKKVMVAGGGIAGIEAADMLNTRGHKPVIYESTNRLGGQFTLAGVAPRKDDFAYAAEMAVRNIEDLGIETHMNCKVTPEILKEERPDALIIANGSKPVIPRIPGVDSEAVMESRSYLEGCDKEPKTAIVIGGGLVGIEVAETLASKGSTVTVVEMKDAILQEMVMSRQICTQMNLPQEPITVMLQTTCKEIKGNAVVVENSEGEQELTADLIVLAIGSKPVDNKELIDTCEELNIPYYVIGDAKAAPRLALDAIQEAYEAVKAI